MDGLLDDCGRPRSDLLGVGIGLSGLIDHHKGLCIKSPFLQWENVPLAQLVTSRLQLKTVIDNDVNAFAAAERLFGPASSCSHILVLTVGRGIGSGMVVSGQTYRGFSGGAGELGHLVSEPGGRICVCGKRGCLEAYASERSLLERYRELRPQVHSVEELLFQCSKGEPIALALVEDAGRRVGMALANMVNLLNPQLIVVGGEGVRLPRDYFQSMNQALHEHLFPGLQVALDIRHEKWGDEAWARGAASLVLQEAFEYQLMS